MVVARGVVLVVVIGAVVVEVTVVRVEVMVVLEPGTTIQLSEYDPDAVMKKEHFI